MPHTHPQTLSSVRNALRLLKLFTVETPDKRLTELAEELNLGKSTTSRLLATLMSEGFVYQDPMDRKYRLGQRITSLYNVIISTYSDLSDLAQPYIDGLVHETSDAVFGAVLEEGEVAYIFHAGNHQDAGVAARGRSPFHCTSSGKLLLAYQKETEVDTLLSNPLQRYTKHTVTDPETIKTQIKEIKKKGYCITEGEWQEGLTAISAPMRDHTGLVISALTLVSRTNRMDAARLRLCTEKVVKTAMRISKEFGYIR